MNRRLPREASLRPNAGVPEEGPADHVANAVQVLYGERDVAKARGRHAVTLTYAALAAVMDRLETALRQLRQQNPAGTVLAVVNPPRRRLIADAVHEVAYRHADDGKDYVHRFKHPDQVRLLIVSDTQVLLDGGRMRIVEMFPD